VRRDLDALDRPASLTRQRWCPPPPPLLVCELLPPPLLVCEPPPPLVCELLPPPLGCELPPPLGCDGGLDGENVRAGGL
jgi:hypothetical protein